MLRYIFALSLIFASVCYAHEDWKDGSTNREHLEGDALKGYLHGHAETIDGVHRTTGFWGHVPESDVSPMDQITYNYKRANEWAKGKPWETDSQIKLFKNFDPNWSNGCAFDDNGDGIFDRYNSSCFNAFVDSQGLTPLGEEDDDPPDEDKPPEKQPPQKKPPRGDQPVKPGEDKPTPLDDSNQPKGVDDGNIIIIDPLPDKDKTDDPMLPQQQRKFYGDGTDIDYQPCIFTSAIVEGLQVVEYMTSLRHTDHDADGNLYFEEVYPQWIEVLNTTDAAINLKDAVLKYTQSYEFTGEIEIDEDFEIGANSVGILATLPPSYYRVWYNTDGNEVVKKEFQPNINGAPYYYFKDAFDHDIDLSKRWRLEYNGKIVFDVSQVDRHVTYKGEACQVLSEDYGRSVLYYSRPKKHRSAGLNATPGYYKKPGTAYYGAPSIQRKLSTTWASLKIK